MKVLITNAYERRQFGDAALVASLIQQIRVAFPGCELRLSGFEQPETHPDFEGAANIGSIRRWAGAEDVSRVRRISRKLACLLLPLLCATDAGRRHLDTWARFVPAEPRRELHAIRDADLMVLVPGGYINAASSSLAVNLSLALLMLPPWLAQRFGVPVVGAPQSYGPLPGRAQRALVRAVLGRSEWLAVREDISMDQLDRMGFRPDRLIRQVDSAFAESATADPAAWRRALGVRPQDTLVLVTARQCLPAEEQDRYERAMAGAIGHLLGGRRDLVVALVPQVTSGFQGDDDRAVHRRIAAHVTVATGLDASLSTGWTDPAGTGSGVTADADGPTSADGRPRLLDVDVSEAGFRDVQSLYAAADLIIGTRFHSVIFGLVGCVPAVAIQYDHKTRGIMRELGFEEWVIDIEDLTSENLTAMCDDVLLQHDVYATRLRGVIPAYRRRADEMIDRLRETVPSGVGTPGRVAG